MRKFFFLSQGAIGIFLALFYPNYNRTGEDINIEHKEEQKVGEFANNSLENVANKQNQHEIMATEGQLYTKGDNHNNDPFPMNENIKVKFFLENKIRY